MACQINVTVEWPKTIPVEVILDQPIPVTVDTTQGLPGPQGPPGPGSEVQDTGWLAMPWVGDFSGSVQVRRWGVWVAIAILGSPGTTDRHETPILALDEGFRPAPGTLAYGGVLDLATGDLDGTCVTLASGDVFWYSHLTGTGLPCQYQWLTPDPFPEL